MAARGKKRSIAKKNKRMTFGKMIVWMCGAGLVGAICAIGVYLVIIVNGHRYLMEHIDKLEAPEASIIYDADRQEVARLLIQNREIVKLDEVPKLLQNAFIATEDKRFSSHIGIDLWAIGRALYRDIVARDAVEGGSTITQQLAKNVFLDFDKTLFRKAQEASIAIALEKHFSKEQILEYYLNRIYFGHGAYGIKAAAKRYFGKENLNELTLGEMAVLAGIPKSPGNFSPIQNPDKALERRNVVLSLMKEQGYITADQMKEAMAEPIQVAAAPAGDKKNFQTFIDYVVREAVEEYGISEDRLLRGGYQIYTTLNRQAQLAMENAYADSDWFQKDMNGEMMQSSMVIYDHHTGGIVAMIGGRDYVAKGLNRAILPRQPGSSFKPIVVYAPALESGKWNPHSLLVDERMSFGNYSPRNYDNVYRGRVTMKEAVRKSINVPAVWLLNEIGISYGMEFASKLGITFAPEDRNLAIALGGMTKGVSPLQMARAYGAFANQGYLNKVHSIVEIKDTNNQTIAAFKPESTQVMSAQTAYYMTEMLQAAVQPGGTGANARMNRPVAGKTGSTQLDIKGLEKYNRDLWFVGYTPEWTAAVWMGFDKTGSRQYVTISSGAPAALFREVMSNALKGVPVKSFDKPKGIKELPSAPGAVNDLQASLDENGRGVLLSWSPKGEGVTYQLFRKSSSEQEFTLLLPGEKTEIKDMSVVPGETYQYYVVVADPKTGLESGKSNIVEITVPEEGDLLPPWDMMPGNDHEGGEEGTEEDENENGEVPVPGLENPGIENPDIQEPDTENPGIENPDGEDPLFEYPGNHRQEQGGTGSRQDDGRSGEDGSGSGQPADGRAGSGRTPENGAENGPNRISRRNSGSDGGSWPVNPDAGSWRNDRNDSGESSGPIPYPEFLDMQGPNF